jgi:hypothetical protein
MTYCNRVWCDYNSFNFAEILNVVRNGENDNDHINNNIIGIKSFKKTLCIHITIYIYYIIGTLIRKWASYHLRLCISI